MVKTEIDMSGVHSRKVVADDLAGRYGNALHLYFVKRGFTRAEAEDLTQEVYLRIAGLSDAHTIREPEAFLFHAAADLLRDKARRDQARHRPDLVAVEAPAEDSAPFRIRADNRSLDGVLRALNELPERQRDVFVLHRFEGLTYTQIAAHLGVSVRAVEKHMTKAIARLHEIRRAGDDQR